MLDEEYGMDTIFGWKCISWDASLYPTESQIRTRLSKENSKVKNKKLQKNQVNSDKKTCLSCTDEILIASITFA